MRQPGFYAITNFPYNFCVRHNWDAIFVLIDRLDNNMDFLHKFVHNFLLFTPEKSNFVKNHVQQQPKGIGISYLQESSPMRRNAYWQKNITTRHIWRKKIIVTGALHFQQYKRSGFTHNFFVFIQISEDLVLNFIFER